MHPLRKRLVWVLTLIVFLVSTADAHVTRVEIVSREDVQGGRAFGLAGAYEKIVGRVYFAVSAENGQKVRLSAPVAHDPGGKEIRGLVRSDFTPSQKTDDMPLGHILLGPSGGKSYPADDPASTKNVLTVRDAPEGQRQSIPRSQWSFAHSVDGKLTADAHYIHLDGGFLL